MGVQSAGIGQHPNSGTAEVLGLWTDFCQRVLKRFAVRGDTEHGEDRNAVLFHLFLQHAGTSEKLVALEFGCGGGRTVDDIRNPAAKRQKLTFFIRTEEAIGKPSLKERWPEAIARSREVMSGPRGIKSGVDAAEKHTQMRRDHIGNVVRSGSEQIGSSGFEMCARHKAECI